MIDEDMHTHTREWHILALLFYTHAADSQQVSRYVFYGDILLLLREDDDDDVLR